MPAFAAVTLNDGAGTPVAHVFDPEALVGLMSTFADRSGGIGIGFPRLTVLSTIPSNAPGPKNNSSTANRVNKVKMKIVLPLLESVTNATYSGIAPAPTKSYDMTCIMEFILPERSTLQNRKDIRAFAKNLLAHAFVTNLVETLETVY